MHERRQEKRFHGRRCRGRHRIRAYRNEIVQNLPDFEGAAKSQNARRTLAKRFKSPFGHRGSGVPNFAGGDGRSAARASVADGDSATGERGHRQLYIGDI